MGIATTQNCTDIEVDSTMEFSGFGDKFAGDSGITQLMHDLNDGLTNPNAIMLGGGIRLKSQQWSIILISCWLKWLPRES